MIHYGWVLLLCLTSGCVGFIFACLLAAVHLNHVERGER
jgi:hypothetical protein